MNSDKEVPARLGRAEPGRLVKSGGEKTPSGEAKGSATSPPPRPDPYCCLCGG